ncbi:atherin-like [Camarhynchus parvulus]|uniref:atherin-like n=1 Tax=Geospiza parvula TaxID=87175 RepID=UPI001237EEC8|nr:atherin-like [Camarhynchus parvulus]
MRDRGRRDSAGTSVRCLQPAASRGSAVSRVQVRAPGPRAEAEPGPRRSAHPPAPRVSVSPAAAPASMRGRLPLQHVAVAVALGVASGLYIYGPLFQPPAAPHGPAAPPPDAAPDKRL